MRIKIIVKAFLLLSCSFSIYGQVYESIEEEAANVFLMNQNNPKSIEGLKKFSSILFSDIDKADLETYTVSPEGFDSLKNHFSFLESEFESISVDSAMFLFNQWYLHFSNTFYDYRKQNFFSSTKTKIILFSASMSCYCTLEICKNQAIDIINFVRENNNEYEYWIVDSYEHNELQIKLETFFAPSVLVFNSNNEVIHKIEYEKEMISILKNHLENSSTNERDKI
jgi:hypothetical protein